MKLSLLSPSYSNTTSNSTTDVYATVSKIMQSQNTGVPKLNAALASDNTTLSGLGKLMSALTTFQSVAHSFSASGDATQLATKVTDLVSSYNALNAGLTGLQQGDLKGDGSVSRIQGQLSRVFSMGSSGSSGTTYFSLRNIGISIQKNGDLVVNSAKLQSAISAEPGDVAKLFTNNGKGIADNLVSQIQGMVGQNGSIQKETQSVNKDITALTAKKNSLANALTAEANALVKQYSQQGSAFGSTASSQTGGNPTLFDMLG